MNKTIVTAVTLAMLLLASLPGLHAGAATLEPLCLDGTQGWIADGNPALDVADGLTLEAWVRPDMVAKGGNRIIDKANAFVLDTAPGMALRMSVAAGTISCTGKLPTDRLSHVVGVFGHAEGIYKLFIDGKEMASQGRDGMRKLSVTPLPVKVGADSSGRHCFCGAIARVTIYNRALNATEVAALAADNSHQSHGLPGTVADWFCTPTDAGEYHSAAPGQLRLRDRPDPARLTGQSPPPANPTQVLWYRRPARAWIEALPLGNGRLGAMVFGGVAEERIGLNEDTLWSGAPHDYNHPGAFEHLAEVRQLITAQKFVEARNLADATMLGIPAGQASYQPLGDLLLTFANHAAAQDYRRELDLPDAIARVSYRIGTARFAREMLISQPDQVMALRLTCDQPGQLSFGLALASPHPIESSATPDGRLAIRGEVKTGQIDAGQHGTRFAAQVRVRADGGSVSAVGN